MRIRPYRPEDAASLVSLFHRAVHGIGDELYSAKQREAWAPTPPDGDWWRERLARMQPEVAWVGARVVGFASLLVTVSGSPRSSLHQGHIDCLFTHPAFQGQGVASALLGQLTQQARAKAVALLTVDASRVAQPFFAARGFEVVCYNRVPLRGEVLENCSMRRRLTR
ncbi:GNAT family N-acetyltransferase [Aestuariirhabdus litorea]|uniref:GNAT family N-acetyltransferase n=1 Tax=Aestuariirhabdus litorea TaxID=2528527 RepID=A0A3P3VLL7_9GAMM|nr:GNAT family N-acetyltransferase [Aestuariirhabdus litorea]RWW93687.1 GNAT family N-acetyltransferase [Endozoicomonadaceae bacterium GTF-13]